MPACITPLQFFVFRCAPHIVAQIATTSTLSCPERATTILSYVMPASFEQMERSYFPSGIGDVSAQTLPLLSNASREPFESL
ncbi:hypothetical protein BKA82DRAFT_1006642 [Pisolithus tinctorius]|uniref:Uncharacterized protein n=1 Tax=Pisolithus tinctorius Marx 270 TaxID=870435 RepID=A0A0C3N6D0_PISTI|nr:hypothetical protein BKA82DRAFT_1006642 [Pisolithus tinctorius]KIN96624.1 hypothetical protein M404DRAFT_1006642 [Pisolithus tinctorius Marx 270]